MKDPSHKRFQNRAVQAGERLVRLSAGIGSVEDILGHLDSALSKL